MTNEQAMRRAIALSRRGFPAPNPHVGCVVVRDGAVVGEGHHAYAGGPHAEVVALRQAGALARGGTAFVTLEPCAHTGRTPPCVDALLEAGVARVVVAVRDPNPRAGGGIELLAEAGVICEHGLLAEEASQANERFLRSHALGRPFVVVKAALSLDGRIALPTGESRWITGPGARAAGRRLRAEMGAVLVGRGTIAADDPDLTARVRGVRNPPVRIVLDPRGVLTGLERVFDDQAPSLRVTTLPPMLKDDWRALGGAESVDLGSVLIELGNRGVNGVLVEGGARTIAAFVQAGLVDRYELFVAPVLLGSGPAWVDDALCTFLSDAPRLRISRVRRRGPDLQVTAYPIL